MRSTTKAAELSSLIFLKLKMLSEQTGIQRHPKCSSNNEQQHLLIRLMTNAVFKNKGEGIQNPPFKLITQPTSTAVCTT